MIVCHGVSFAIMFCASGSLRDDQRGQRENSTEDQNGGIDVEQQHELTPLER